MQRISFALRSSRQPLQLLISPSRHQLCRTMATTTDTSSINARIAELGTLIKSLKASSSPFDTELKEMLALKSQLAPAAPPSGPKLQLKTPKGTKDHGPAATLLRQGIFD